MFIRTRHVSVPAGSRSVPTLILSPNTPLRNAPGVLWIHGGGYCLGMKEMVYIGRARELVSRFGAVVVSPGYRLSPFAPYPAAPDDCYAVLLWMKRHAEELGIRRDQLMVGGESAGGGLCCSVCIRARDEGRVHVAYQMPLYPMLDNLDTETSRDNHAKLWNTRRNHIGWRLYLRGDAKRLCSPYAVPARLTDFSGLPPACSFVTTAEPFYAETVRYFEGLKNAGIPAELSVYPGLYHAFDMMEPDNPVSREAAETFCRRFEYARGHYFAENPD